jgi:hypothetical protein
MRVKFALPVRGYLTVVLGKAHGEAIFEAAQVGHIGSQLVVSHAKKMKHAAHVFRDFMLSVT